MSLVLVEGGRFANVVRVVGAKTAVNLEVEEDERWEIVAVPTSPAEVCTLNRSREEGTLIMLLFLC